MLRQIYYRLGVFWTVVVLTALSVLISVSVTYLTLFLFAPKEGRGLGLTIATALPLTIAPLMSSLKLNFMAQLDQSQQENARLVAELRETLANVKTLSGLVPICSSCKKIRDDKGYWQNLELYITNHSDATLTHGYCPECAEELHSEIAMLRRKMYKGTDPAL